jgi:hypothetical protein
MRNLVKYVEQEGVIESLLFPGSSI